MPIDTYAALRSITRVLKQVPPQKRGPILHLASLEAQEGCGCSGNTPVPTREEQGTLPPEEPQQGGL
jgi:hypothetical protein